VQLSFGSPSSDRPLVSWSPRTPYRTPWSLEVRLPTCFLPLLQSFQIKRVTLSVDSRAGQVYSLFLLFLTPRSFRQTGTISFLRRPRSVSLLRKLNFPRPFLFRRDGISCVLGFFLRALLRAWAIILQPWTCVLSSTFFSPAEGLYIRHNPLLFFFFLSLLLL